MMNREAIEILKKNLACGENQCPFFVDCSECEYRTENHELAEAIIMAISALEKQEKKPAKAKFNKRYNRFVYFCPVCGEVTGHYDYCSDCGQAIDYNNSESYEAEEES